MDFILNQSCPSVQATASYSRVLTIDQILQNFRCVEGWKWSVLVGTPAYRKLDPVLEVQDDAMSTVLLSHLLPLLPVRHFLQSLLAI